MDQKQLAKALSDADVLMLNKKSLQYFGTLSYGIKKEVLTPEQYQCIMPVPSLAFTDNQRIVYMVSDNLQTRHFIAVTIHEILHILSDHIGRRGNRIPELWQLAIDHVVNRTVRNLPYGLKTFVELPEPHVFFEKVDSKHPKISAEELYDLMKKNYKEDKDGNFEINMEGDKIKGKKIYIYVPDGKGGKGSKGDPQDGDGKKFEGLEVTDSSGKKTVSSMDCKPAPGQTTDAASKQNKEFIQKGRTIWNSNMISKGDVPGDMLEFLDKIFEVPIPWEEIVHSAILYYTQSNSMSTWSQRDIYIRHVILPSYCEGKDTEVLVAVIDTSGSISNKDLEKFVGVLMGSVDHFKALHIILHDVNITEEFILDNRPTKGELVNKFKKEGFKGRGGTSHLDVFNRLELLAEEELISSTVFLTDFYSDVEHIYMNYAWIKSIPSIWVLNNDKKVILDQLECKTINIPQIESEED